MKPLILLSLPALREKDLAFMPNLKALTANGDAAELVPSFPCVTCVVQTAMTTGKTPSEHGIVANGIYWRDRRRVELWTAPNDCIEQPQIWDLLSHHGGLTSAVWFPLHSKGCEADYVCTPAPIHNPDGSESLWCYTRPPEMYGELRDALGHFPLMNYWGPLAGVKASQWIANSAVWAAERWRPDFFYIYLPTLDYAAQRNGPDSAAARKAVEELDELLGRFVHEMTEAYGEPPLWIAAGEYAITPVNHVAYPNRMLREVGLLSVQETPDGELIDFEKSLAFAMVDHQVSHVFVQNADPRAVELVADVFRGEPGFAEVLVGDERSSYRLDHARCGDLVLVSSPESWQAYYYWQSDDRAPRFARTVDIHRKPGYDPVELFWDMASKSVPLDATLVKGSHGAPANDPSQRTIILASEPGLFPAGQAFHDRDVFNVVMQHFGLQ